MGESKFPPLRVNFDRRLKLEFLGSKITSDAGLLPAHVAPPDEAAAMTVDATARFASRGLGD